MVDDAIVTASVTPAVESNERPTEAMIAEQQTWRGNV